MTHDGDAYLQQAKKRFGEELPKVVDKLAAGLRRRLGEPPYELDLPTLTTLVRDPRLWTPTQLGDVRAARYSLLSATSRRPMRKRALM